MNSSFYTGLLHLHSAGRWIILILLLVAIGRHLTAGNRAYTKSDARTGLILTIVSDLMLLIGLFQWWAGSWGLKAIERLGMGETMKEPTYRFFAVEHFAGMLIAIILIHIGKAQGKKALSDRAKHRRTAIFYLIALLIILVSIPWPFREVGSGRGWL